MENNKISCRCVHFDGTCHKCGENPQDNVPKGELYAANENERKSLIDWYKDHTHVELHDEGINTLCKICPPEEYGEDSDCESIQNIIRVMFYRIAELEAENQKYREALDRIAECRNKDMKYIHPIMLVKIAEQAVKG